MNQKVYSMFPEVIWECCCWLDMVWMCLQGFTCWRLSLVWQCLEVVWTYWNSSPLLMVLTLEGIQVALVGPWSVLKSCYKGNSYNYLPFLWLPFWTCDLFLPLIPPYLWYHQLWSQHQTWIDAGLMHWTSWNEELNKIAFFIRLPCFSHFVIATEYGLI